MEIGNRFVLVFEHVRDLHHLPVDSFVAVIDVLLLVVSQFGYLLEVLAMYLLPAADEFRRLLGLCFAYSNVIFESVKLAIHIVLKLV